MQQYHIKSQAPALDEIFEIEDGDTLGHMFRVMRLNEGDLIQLVFDDRKLALTEVVEGQKFKITEFLERSVELPVDVTIAMGYPKGDKLDFLAQKGTELGMHALWGFPADWSVAKLDHKKIGKRANRLEKIAQGASEQSKRLVVPKVQLFENKGDFLNKLSNFDLILVAYEESAKEEEKAGFVQALETLKFGQRVLVIFGPEGGISPKEIDCFLENGAKIVGLGPRIMRAETAPLYALSSLSFYLELLNNKE
ncbi:16S rRNA (uracil(1498)-N(3))-methyltransferase [Streptococcaceae bacterium ESL0729]|nr:16S rRNA (uracil(1498)-N(3))-methyltransferase [Streptococcaceae bacterium ESL0729]